MTNSMATFMLPNLVPASAEIFVLAMVSLILIVDLFDKDPKRSSAYLLSLGTMVGAGLITVAVGGNSPTTTFSNMFVSDALADVLKLMVYGSMFVLLVYSRSTLGPRDLLKGEFYTLSLFAMLGMMVMISANHFLTVYLGLELLTLSLYALVALQRDSAAASEAAMKYFVLGALASGMLLYGMSMIYGATGTLDINQISMATQSAAVNHTVLVFGLVFLVSGIAFKLGAVPFHMWVPDVYHGAPTAVTLIIASAPKFAAFAMMMRLLVGSLIDLAVDWQQMLTVLSVLSLAIGNITAIAQTNIKRMLAYSTIGHMGFMLLGMLAGVIEGNRLSAFNAYSSSMFYVAVYVLTTLGSFGMILLLSRAGFEADTLEDFKGLNTRSPWFAFLMLLIMFSLAGVPPTVGFYAKLSVLQAVVDAGQVWLAVVAVMFSLIGAFYYLRVVKLMYFDEPKDLSPITPNFDMSVVLSINGLAVLGLGILPGPLMTVCKIAMVKSLAL
jgi:NADH-quinone oxidoreductase subunit N